MRTIVGLLALGLLLIGLLFFGFVACGQAEVKADAPKSADCDAIRVIAGSTYTAQFQEPEFYIAYSEAGKALPRAGGPPRFLASVATSDEFRFWFSPSGAEFVRQCLERP